MSTPAPQAGWTAPDGGRGRRRASGRHHGGGHAAGTGNATLQSDVTVLNALLHMEDDASLQRAYLYQALETAPPALTPRPAC